MTKTNDVHGETRKYVGMGICGWGGGRTKGGGGGEEAFDGQQNQRLLMLCELIYAILQISHIG